MTFERKMIVGIDDIKAVTFEQNDVAKLEQQFRQIICMA